MNEMKIISYVELKEKLRCFAKELMEYKNINIDYDETKMNLYVSFLMDWQFREIKNESNND